jgi:hypothetical protein
LKFEIWRRPARTELVECELDSPEPAEGPKGRRELQHLEFFPLEFVNLEFKNYEY